MSSAAEKVAMAIPVVNGLWWVVTKIMARRARVKAAKAAGKPRPPIDMSALREGVDKAQDIVEELTPREGNKNPRPKGLR